MTAPVFEVRGFNVSGFSWQGPVNGPQAFREALAPALEMGVNTLIFDLGLQQPNLTASTVSTISQDGSGGRFAYDTLEVAAGMTATARAMGFDVWIKPIVLIGGLASTEPSAYTWWAIDPDSPDDWFASYRQQLMEIVSVIEPLGAEGLLLGNELMSMTGDPAYRDDWLALIDAIRPHFSGRIGYNASGLSQGGVYPDEVSRVSFLDALDFIGISAYPRLYTGTTPTREQMQAGWYADVYGQDDLVAGVRQLVAANPHLDVYFTELGSPSTDGGNVMLYDILGSANNDPRYLVRDLEEQRLFFDVSLELLSRELGGEIGGVFPYNWSASTLFMKNPGQFPEIWTWSLEGKPAAETIGQWYSGLRSAPGVALEGSLRNDVLGGGFYDDTVAGGRGDDVLRGNAGNDALHGNGIVLGPGATVQLEVYASGGIYLGEAPRVAVWANGVLVGRIDVPEINTSPLPDGQPWHGPATYTFALPAGVPITDLRLVEENWIGQSAGAWNRNFYVPEIRIDGVELQAPWTMVFDGGGEGPGALAIYSDGYLRIDAQAYNDVLASSAADNDTLDGGAGIDTAFYAAPRAQAAIALDAASPQLAASVTVPGLGTDTLADVERLRFDDVAVALDIYPTGDVDDPVTKGDGGNAGKAYRLYQAAFAREPDAQGLGYWIAQVDAGAKLFDIATGFIESAEFATLYGAAPSNAEYTRALYLNVLGREPDAPGYAYWNALLEGQPWQGVYYGSTTRQQMLVDFSEGAENKANVAALIGNGFDYAPWG